jgi:zinc/manganese transport system substrate-binding protein
MRLSAVLIIIMMALCHHAEAANAPLRVVASFSILADIARNIGDDAVEVTSLVGADSDAHTFQPSPEDAKKLAKADLILINGLGFEGWMQRLIEASGSKAKVVTVSDGLQARAIVTPQGTVDPHAWQNLANGRLYAKNIATAFELARPSQASAIAARANDYDAELDQMDRSFRQQFAEIPRAQRKIITSHDAFGYFGAAYGVTFLAPVGVSTDAEPSASDIAALIQQIKAEGIKQIFIENMSNPQLIKQISKDAGVRLGGALYADALSAANGPAPTYVAMFNNNVRLLKSAMLLNRP